MLFPLHHYQTTAKDATHAALKEFDRILIVKPTGAGKTVLFSALAEDWIKAGKRVLILCHRTKLVDQAIDKLQKFTGLKAQREQAEFTADRSAVLVVASIQTLGRRFQTWPPDAFDYIVCDEAHHALSDSWRTVLDYFHAKVVGVTATPHRGDMRNLGRYFQTVACEIPLFDTANNPHRGLVETGFLAPIVIKTIPLPIDLNKVGVAFDSESGCKDFKREDLAAAIEPYLDEIAVQIKAHAPSRRTLAFCPLISTSKKFVDSCCRAGIRAAHVDGEMNDRNEVVACFEAGHYDLLSNAMLLTEGYDVDSEPTGVGIDCLVVLRLTKSQPLYAQMVGRGTRLAAFKENLLLLDFLWNSEKHEIMRPARLIARDDFEARQINEMLAKAAALPPDVAEQMPLDLRDLASDAALQREEKLRQELEANRHRESKVMTANSFALQHHAAHLASYEPVMQVDAAPPTNHQMKWLKKVRVDKQNGQIYTRNIPSRLADRLAKLDLSSVSCRGHAEELLKIVFNKKYQAIVMASPAQRALMERFGHPNADRATADEAKAFFVELNRRKKEPMMI